ncbi:hypothetical protein ACFLSQ_08520 [Bacteroidota bacterium]
MKRFFLSILIVIAMLFIFNQKSLANYPISVGPFIGLKGGVNAADIPWGSKNGFAFNTMPEIGVTGYLPFVEDAFFGGAVDLAYSTSGFLMKYGELKHTHQYNYFNFSPYLYASGFTLGLNFGIPLGGTISSSNNDEDVDSDDMATLIDVRLGGMIDVYANETGRLNIIIVGSYSLSGLLNKEYGGEYNYHPGQMYIGLNYMFNLVKE